MLNKNKFTKETNESKTNFTKNDNTNLSNTNIETHNINIQNNPQIKFQNEKLYEEKLKELEQEISTLKEENESVSNIKQEYQRLYMELNQEIDNFYMQKESEKKEFEKWKEDEIRKIQKDKKASEAKSSRLNQNIIPSKKDKEEIECLKNIIAKMQEEFKIKDNNNKLTIEKLKRKLEESNSKINELNNLIEDLTHKNTIMRSNSTNMMKVININNNNPNNPGLITASCSSTNVNSNNKRIINYKEANSINNIHNQSTHISPSTQGLLNRNTDEPNSNKTKKSINSKHNTSSSGSANLLNNFNLNANNNNDNIINNINELNKQKGSYAQRNSEDLNKITAKQILAKKDSKEIVSKTNNYMSNKSIELVKKLSTESDIKIKQKSNFNPPLDNITSDFNVPYNAYDDGVYDLVFLEIYHPRNDLNANVIKHENFPDGKIVKFYDNDKREVIFPSGVRKEIFPDGYQLVYFNNKDIKQVI